MEKKKHLIRPANNSDGIILTDLSFRPFAVTQGAACLLEGPNPLRDRLRSASYLRDELLACLKRLRPDEVSGAHIRFNIGSVSYICHISVLQPCFDSSVNAMLALKIQKNQDAGEVMRIIAQEFDLTEREYQALLNVSLGLSCKEMAERMKISPNTVKAFLRIVMIKMGVDRRAGIISKVLEYTQGGNGVTPS